jgi:hypothetical protein
MDKSLRRLLPAIGGLLLITACGTVSAAGQSVVNTTTPTTTTTTIDPPARFTTTTPTTTTPSPTPTSTPAPSCPVAPTTVSLPHVDELQSVPVADRVRVRIGGLPANSRLVAGGKPVEFTVTVCNNSPVNYPSIAPAVVSDRCECAPGPVYIPKGTLERFYPATGTWHTADEFSMGTGMDYLMVAEPVTPLPKGKEITYRYRIAYAAGMTAGQGGISATAVGLPNHIQAGVADLPLAVTVR